MPIDKTNTIDLIGIDRYSGNAMLTITDYLEWDDIPNHLQLLQDKINCYLQFIESGEIYQSYPNAIGRKIIIEVVCKFAPPQEAILFLEKAKYIIDETGIELKW